MTATSSNPVRGPQVAGEPALDRLMRSLDYRLSPGVEPVTRGQVAVVLNGLADHTAIMAALQWRREPDEPWADALSIGRWLHDTADQARDIP